MKSISFVLQVFREATGMPVQYGSLEAKKDGGSKNGIDLRGEQKMSNEGEGRTKVSLEEEDATVEG